MPTLLIDTATDHVVVALADGERVLAGVSNSEVRAQSVLALVDDVLGDAGCTRKDIETVAVGIGPGTFTGVRVGVATARGIASAMSVPLIPISTLAAVAWPQCVEAGDGVRVWADVDAKRNERFIQPFAFSSRTGTVEALEDLTAVSSDELHRLVDGDQLVSGSPTPEGLAAAAVAGSPVSVFEVVPVYGREPDARSTAERTPVEAKA